MDWAALIFWIVTAAGGFVLLGDLASRRGNAAARGRTDPPPLILEPLRPRAIGLVLWFVYLANGSDTLAWIAFVLLLVVALLGFTMFAIWAGRRRAETRRRAASPCRSSGCTGCLQRRRSCLSS